MCLGKEEHRVGILPFRIGVREQPPDITECGGAEDGIREGMADGIGVGMAEQTQGVGDDDTPEHQAPAGPESV